MFSISKFFSALFLSVFLSGCGAQIFTDRKADPILKAKLGTLDIAANTAVRRNVYIRTDDAPNAGELVYYDNQETRMGGHKGEFCAEPPPEALEAIVSSFSAEASKTNGTKAASAEFSKEFATAVVSNFRRSQGIQFYRDVSFTLCTAMVNGYIPASEYIEQLWRVREKAAAIMLAEFQTAAWKNELPPKLVFAKPLKVEEEEK